MIYLFIYYPLLNIIFSLLVLNDCNSFVSNVIISRFNTCNSEGLITVIFIMLIVILTYIVMEILRVIILPGKISKNKIVNKKINLHKKIFKNYLSVNSLLFVWFFLFALHFVLKNNNISYFKVLGINFVLAAYILPLLIYVRMFIEDKNSKKTNYLYFFITFLSSFFLYSKVHFLYYFSYLFYKKFGQEKLISNIYFLLKTFILIMFIYFILQTYRSVYFYGSELEGLPSISIILLKMITRFLLIDQITWCINLYDFSMNTSIHEVAELSKNQLYEYGYKHNNFGFALSIFGPFYVIYGIFSIPLITVSVYSFFAIICRFIKIKMGGWFVFPVGLQILNNGLNFHTMILICSFLIVATLSFRVRKL